MKHTKHTSYIPMTPDALPKQRLNIANVFKSGFTIEEAMAAHHGLTKADIRDVMNDCNGLINGKFIHIKCK